MSDCAGYSNCTQSATPIQAAINFFAQNSATIAANDRAIFVEGGTYSETVSINGLSDFSLRGSANGSLSVIDGSVTIANSVGINLSAFMVTAGVTVANSQNVAVMNVATTHVTVANSQNVAVSNSQVTTNDESKPAIVIEASEKVRVENVNLDSSIRVDNSANVSIVDSGGNDALHLIANNVSELDLLSSGDLTLSGDSRVTSPSGVVNLRADEILTMEEGSVIDASAQSVGDGGAVNLIAGQATNFYGTILARGGELGGNGGNVEVSGAQVNYRGSVDLSAPHGAAGTLLLDPGDFTVAASGGNITGTALGTQMNSGNVTIQTSAAGGNLTFNDGVSWTSGYALTALAHNSIAVNANLTSTGSGSVILHADSDGGGSGTVTFGSGNTISLTGGSGGKTVTVFYNPSSYAAPTSYAGNVTAGTLTAYMLVNTLNNLQAMGTNSTTLAGKYALGTDIDASATATWNWNGTLYQGFVPIGNDSTPFTGQFNGDGHTISGLYINRATTVWVGLFGSSGGGATISNVGVVNGNITGDSYVGGLVGFNYSTSTIQNSYSTGAVSGNQDVGGLVGWNYYGTIQNSYSTGTASGNQDVGGLVGENDFGTITNSYSTGAVSGSSYVGGLVGINNRGTGTITNSYSTGAVSGTSDVGGLVGRNNSTITNSYSTGAVSGAERIGGLVGQNDASISNSYSTGAVSGTSDVGGLVGINDLGTITNSYSTGAVTATGSGHYFGGLVGWNSGTITNSYSTGAVTATGYNYYVGGLVGWNASGTITNSYSTGAVSGSQFVGGLVGRNDYGTIQNSYSTGTASGTWWVGGLVGINYYGTITNSYSTGAVTATGSGYYVGGLVGSNGYGTITNSYSTGAVSGSWYVGGLVGINGFGTSTITNSYSTGAVSGTSDVGGLVGRNNSTITNSYWDTQTSGQEFSAGGTGKTTVQMKQQATFSGWNFTTVWRITENVTYPVLLIPLTITANNDSKTYGQIKTYGAGATAFTSVGLQNNETIGSVTLASTGGAATAAVGSYDITPSAATGGTFTASNYTITYQHGTLTVNKAALTVSATGVNKIYDGNTDATVTLSDNRVSGDVFTNSYTSATFADKNVANGIVVSVSGISISGTDSGNYNLLNTTAATTANITKRDLTVSATGVNKVYDGNTDATVTLSDNRVSGDVLTDNYTSATFADKNVANGIVVSVSGISISGTDSGNYNLLNTTAMTTANITKRDLTITADDKSRFVGTSNPPLSASYAGFVLGEGPSALLTPAALWTTANVASLIGSYPINVGGATAANYAITFVNGVLTVVIPPVPPSGGGLGGGGAGAAPGGALIPIAGGEVIGLGSSAPTTIQLSNGDQVTVPAGSGDSVIVSSVGSNELPAQLSQPSGLTIVTVPTYEFISAVNVTVLRDGVVIDTPTLISYVLPPEFAGRTLVVLEWDPTLNGGLGGWVEHAVSVGPDGRVSFTATHSGLFVLAAK